MTNAQIRLLKILASKKDMQLGEIREKYFSTKENNCKYLMKRNSKMASWLNQLSNKGLVKITHYGHTIYNNSQPV